MYHYRECSHRLNRRNWMFSIRGLGVHVFYFLKIRMHYSSVCVGRFIENVKNGLEGLFFENKVLLSITIYNYIIIIYYLLYAHIFCRHHAGTTPARWSHDAGTTPAPYEQGMVL